MSTEKTLDALIARWELAREDYIKASTVETEARHALRYWFMKNCKNYKSSILDDEEDSECINSYGCNFTKCVFTGLNHRKNLFENL